MVLVLEIQGKREQRFTNKKQRERERVREKKKKGNIDTQTKRYIDIVNTIASTDKQRLNK